MTYLELCQRLHREMRDSGSGMQSVENQSGVNAEVVDYIREAWVDIQIKRDWDVSFWGSKPVELDPATGLPVEGAEVVKYSKLAPQYLKTSLDIPFLPEPFHMMIVYSAMMGDSLRLNAPELRAKAEEKFGQLEMSLVNEYVGVGFGVPEPSDAIVELP